MKGSRGEKRAGGEKCAEVKSAQRWCAVLSVGLCAVYVYLVVRWEEEQELRLRVCER